MSKKTNDYCLGHFTKGSHKFVTTNPGRISRKELKVKSNRTCTKTSSLAMAPVLIGNRQPENNDKSLHKQTVTKSKKKGKTKI